MKKVKFFVVAALALGMLSACSNDDQLKGGNSKVVEGTTYMSVTLTMPQGALTRADNQNQDNPEYNYVGKWAGQDDIKSIEVYVFNDGGVLEGGVTTFATGDFSVATGADNKVNITPTKGIKVNPGAKTVYVVVNPTTESTAYLAGKTSLSEFKTAYEGIMNTLTSDPSPADATHALVSTVADKIAKVESNKDVILMTVAKTAGTVTVEKNVKEAETIANSSPKNRAKVEVKRAVARVMVTTRAANYEIKGDDATTPTTKETDFVIGTLTDIKYVVAQGEKSLYFQQKVNEGNENLSIETPNSAYVTSGDFNAEAPDKYDYTGLWRGYNTDATQISGTPVPTKTLYDANPSTTLGNISADLVAQLKGEFILPNTHLWGETQDATNYRKGNTAYVLVRAKFKPSKVVMADGTINESYPDNTDFVLGKNGIFYENKTVARDPAHMGVADQSCNTYLKGKMLYYAWVNPDKVPGWINSPVIRNNIYHIEITGFKTIGVNWNPLVPDDPDTPNPDPDPEPEDPDPDQPDPDDPLTPSETWMSVETAILPWDVHSYGVEL